MAAGSSVPSVEIMPNAPARARALAPALALLFLSPVAYSARSLSGVGEVLYSLNPIVGVLELGRWVLIGAPWPGWTLAVSMVSAALLAVTGVVYFQRAQRAFADVI